MPMDRSKYPENWREISAEARERAGHKCQHCGLPNGAVIVRSNIDPARYLVWDTERNCFRYGFGKHEPVSEGEFLLGEEYDGKVTKVVLTVHHAGVAYPDGTPGDPTDKMDNRPENLQCLCQRCHLLADLQHNIKARRVTRLVNKHDQIVASGQYELFGGIESE